MKKIALILLGILAAGLIYQALWLIPLLRALQRAS